jgi:U4/U6.U5 tri-snRNP component SNU23
MITIIKNNQPPPGDHRRKWDVEEYEEQAKKRELEDSDEEDKPKVKRELLKARDYKVNTRR